MDMSFVYKGIDSKDYFIVNKLPSIYRAAKDVEKIEIPGRDGFLTNDLGSYKSILKTVECTIKDLSQIDFICNWLTGNGDVIFGNEDNRIYKATIINQIEFSQILRTYHRFLIQFECQPKKYSLDNSTLTLTNPGTIFNTGTDTSNPVIKLYGTGTIVLTINGKDVTLTNVVTSVTVDSELMDCYKGTVLKNNEMVGNFPILIPGSNSISWTGTVTKIEVIVNKRWL